MPLQRDGWLIRVFGRDCIGLAGGPVDHCQQQPQSLFLHYVLNPSFQLQFLILCRLDLGLSPLCDAYEDLEEHGIISVYRD